MWIECVCAYRAFPSAKLKFFVVRNPKSSITEKIKRRKGRIHKCRPVRSNDLFVNKKVTCVVQCLKIMWRCCDWWCYHRRNKKWLNLQLLPLGLIVCELSVYLHIFFVSSSLCLAYLIDLSKKKKDFSWPLLNLLCRKVSAN